MYIDYHYNKEYNTRLKLTQKCDLKFKIWISIFFLPKII